MTVALPAPLLQSSFLSDTFPTIFFPSEALQQPSLASVINEPRAYRRHSMVFFHHRRPRPPPQPGYGIAHHAGGLTHYLHNSGFRSARPPSSKVSILAPHRLHGRFPLPSPLVYVMGGPACRAASASNPRWRGEQVVHDCRLPLLSPEGGGDA